MTYATSARMRVLACPTTLIAVTLVFAGFAWAATPCSKSDEQAAEDRVGRLKTWQSVHSAYKQFAHCDDGSIGQGFSESITLLLDKRWHRVDQLNRLIATDQGLEAFVLRHVDPTVPVERLNSIASNATLRCPRNTTVFCRKLAGRAIER